MINAWVVGNKIVALATLKNRSNASIDPGWIKIKFRSPAGVITQYDWPAGVNLATRTATGKFEASHVCAVEGEWSVRMETDIDAVSEGHVNMTPSDFV